MDSGDERWFSVQAENENRNGVLDVSWVKRVIIKLPGHEVIFEGDHVVYVSHTSKYCY